MKFSEIEVGKTYMEDGYERHVKYKNDCTLKVVADNGEHLIVWSEEHYKNWTEILPETGLLVSKNGSLVYRTGEENGYGFDFDSYEFHNGWTFKVTPNNWRTATEEEEKLFVEKLEAEAKRRGLFEDTKLKTCLYQSNQLNNRVFMPSFFPNRCWNKNGCIFFNGEWAEPLEEEPSSRIDELLKELRAECGKHGFDLDVIIKTR